MTIAPKVQVYTQLACNEVLHHPIDYDESSIHGFHTHSFARVLTHATITSTTPIIGGALQIRNGTASLSSGLHAFVNSQFDEVTHSQDECLSDPLVQARAARLQTIMMTTMGLLTALTTGWWGHFGERYGRTRALAVAACGMVISDLIFFLVSFPQSPFARHGHKLLYVAPFIEGATGGWSTLQAATTAYISDCTSDGSRSHIFSRFTGVYYLGFAVGPTLGAFLITHPPPLPFQSHVHAQVSRSMTPVFWVSALLSIVNFLMVVFVFPESLTKERRAARDAAAAEARANANVLAGGAATITESEHEMNEGARMSAVKGIFAPLAVFAPRMRVSANGKLRKDWSMTFLALALFGYLLSTVR
jgi:MFS family permease